MHVPSYFYKNKKAYAFLSFSVLTDHNSRSSNHPIRTDYFFYLRMRYISNLNVLTCSTRRRIPSYRGSVGFDAPPGRPYWRTCCPDISVRHLLDFGNKLDPLRKLKKGKSTNLGNDAKHFPT